jgi:hypothetical protein
MAVSKDEASTADVFHENAQRKDGTCYAHRRHGRTQTWKTRPDEFRTPIVYGLRGYGQLTETNAGSFHLPGSDECPEVTRDAARPRPARGRASR